MISRLPSSADDFNSQVIRGQYILELQGAPVLARVPTKEEDQAATLEVRRRIRAGESDWCFLTVLKSGDMVVPPMSFPGVLSFNARFRFTATGLTFLVRGLLLPRAQFSADKVFNILTWLALHEGHEEPSESYRDQLRESEKNPTTKVLWIPISRSPDETPKVFTAADILESSLERPIGKG